MTMTRDSGRGRSRKFKKWGCSGNPALNNTGECFFILLRFAHLTGDTWLCSETIPTVPEKLELFLRSIFSGQDAILFYSCIWRRFIRDSAIVMR